MATGGLMKIFITLMILSIAPSVFAEGSWNLSCVSDKGISLNSSNGLSEIEYKINLAESSVIAIEEVEVENYDLGLTEAHVQLKWVGSPSILSESSENICSADQATTIFKQKANIVRAGKIINTVDMVCTDSVITSSGAEAGECSDEQI